MSFTFNTSIPAAANNPSVDQPDMLTNNQSTDSILAVDHISFNTANGGNHLQVHMPFFRSPSVVNGTATEGSVVWGAAGTANAARAQCFFKNDSNINNQLNAVKAWGYSSGSVASPGNSIINSQQINRVSVVRTSTGNYTVTMTSGTMSTADYAVLVTPYSSGSSSSIVVNVAISSADVFVITFRQPSNGAAINVQFFAFEALQI
jgi:hypothetical protein